MIYKIRLENLENGQEAVITAPANVRAEQLSPKIKMALHLPYIDYAWHRFVARGTTYVIDEHMEAEPEIWWESGLKPGRYRCSERITVEHLFTSIGSSVHYRQDRSLGSYNIRCTLIKRIL